MAFYGNLIIKVGGVIRQYVGGGLQLFVDTKISTVTLTPAQIRALFATPVSLIATPGAGFTIQVVNIMATNTFGTAAYTGANALEFRYTDGSGTKVTADIAAAFINIGSGTQTNSVAGVITDFTHTANAPLVVRVPTADPGGGTATGTIRISVLYRVIPTT